MPKGLPAPNNRTLPAKDFALLFNILSYRQIFPPRIRQDDGTRSGPHDAAKVQLKSSAGTQVRLALV
jgi:hypothetical protein